MIPSGAGRLPVITRVYLRNAGDRTFTMAALPTPAQISPIRGIVADDVDGNGTLDLIVAGNMYHTEPSTLRMDAGSGLWLRGDGTGRLHAGVSLRQRLPGSAGRDGSGPGKHADGEGGARRQQRVFPTGVHDPQKQ